MEKLKRIYFDSQEEWFFAMWCEELKQAGYIKDWKKVIDSIPLTEGLKCVYEKVTVLKTKTKKETKEHILLRPSEYTPDFAIMWTIDGFALFLSGVHNDFDKNKLFFNSFFDKPTYIEIKPFFDQNNMERLFVNNQKFIWDKHQIFVNLVEPVELFKKTFLPLTAAPYFKYRKSPTGKNKGIKQVGDWKMDWQPKTINEYLCL